MGTIPFEDYPVTIQFQKIKEKLSEAIRFLDDATGDSGRHSDYHGALVCMAAAYNMMDLTRKYWPKLPTI